MQGKCAVEMKFFSFRGEKYLNKLSITHAKRIAKESKDDKDIDEFQSLVSEKKTINREE